MIKHRGSRKRVSERKTNNQIFALHIRCQMRDEGIAQIIFIPKLYATFNKLSLWKTTNKESISHNHKVKLYSI